MAKKNNKKNNKIIYKGQNRPDDGFYVLTKDLKEKNDIIPAGSVVEVKYICGKPSNLTYKSDKLIISDSLEHSIAVKAIDTYGSFKDGFKKMFYKTDELKEIDKLIAYENEHSKDIMKEQNSIFKRKHKIINWILKHDKSAHNSATIGMIVQLVVCCIITPILTHMAVNIKANFNLLELLWFIFIAFFDCFGAFMLTFCVLEGIINKANKSEMSSITQNKTNFDKSIEDFRRFIFSKNKSKSTKLTAIQPNVYEEQNNDNVFNMPSLDDNIIKELGYDKN